MPQGGAPGAQLPLKTLNADQLPPDPPFFRRSTLSQQQLSALSSFVTEFFSIEESLGPFRAGSVNAETFSQMLGSSFCPLEREIISKAANEALGHTIPWEVGPPPPAAEFSFRTPEMFLPEEAAAIDKDIEEGVANGTYLEVAEAQVAACLARRPVLQGEKYRIIDNARPVNLFMDKDRCSVRYEDLQWARATAAPFMSKIDLRKGYRQIRLASGAKPFFCFFWRGRLYQFQVMAFGDASAPQGFTKFMKGFALRWRKMGVTCIIYLDDILVTAHSFEKWLWSIKRITSDLSYCGVRIGIDKFFLGPFECLEFLGVFIDYAASSLFISETRLQKAAETCTALLIGDAITVREVQVFLGHLSFFSAAHQGLSLFRRSLDLWVADNSDVEAAPLSSEAEAELMLLRDALPSWSHRSFKTLPFANCIMITDAAEHAWAGILVSGNSVLLAAHDPLPAELLGASSLAREMFALLSFFKICLKSVQLSDQRVQVQMDNKGASFLVNKTKAKTPDTIAIMRELLTLQEKSNTFLIAEWRERTDGLVSLVDLLSKLEPPLEKNLKSTILKAVFPHQGPPRDSKLGKSEWSLGRDLFNSICDWAWGKGEKPEIDLFATWSNRQVEKFCSRFYSPESLGNAFSLNWDNRRLYAFPPFSQIPSVVQKLGSASNVSLALVTKFDRSSPAWPLLLALSPKKRWEIKSERVSLCSGGAAKSHPPFDLVVLLFVKA